MWGFWGKDLKEMGACEWNEQKGNNYLLMRRQYKTHINKPTTLEQKIRSILLRSFFYFHSHLLRGEIEIDMKRGGGGAKIQKS